MEKKNTFRLVGTVNLVLLSLSSWRRAKAPASVTCSFVALQRHRLSLLWILQGTWRVSL